MLVYKGYRFKVIRETITRQLFCAFRLMCDLNSIRRFCVLLQNTKLPRNKYCPNIFAKNLRRHLHTYVFGAINVLSYMKNFALRTYFNVKSPTIHGIKQKILLFTIHLRNSRSKQFSLGQFKKQVCKVKNILFTHRMRFPFMLDFTLCKKLKGLKTFSRTTLHLV